VLAALAAMHLLALHQHGSSNPLGISGNVDRLSFHPFFTFKDLVTIFLFLLTLSIFVFYMPNVLGHSWPLQFEDNNAICWNDLKIIVL
jgi:ubiquinol-cytochrome c reductase cytochrome b subunit